MRSTRRQLVQWFGSAGLVSLAAHPPAFLQRLQADTTEHSTNRKGRVLVVVQLAGGNDGLNTVIPYGHDNYYRQRPSLAVPTGQVLRLNHELGLHPALTGLKKLYDAGKLAIIQGVGYPQPNRSHFRSMDIWHSAQPETEQPLDGWLGRTLEHLPADRLSQLPALALGMERLPLALQARSIAIPSVQNPQDYTLRFDGVTVAEQRQRRQRLVELAQAQKPAADQDQLAFLRRTSQTAYATASQLQEVLQQQNRSGDYPNSQLGQQLRFVAQLIASELSTEIYYLSLDGFDTHNQQAAVHNNLLTELSAALSAFSTDLQHQGWQDRVLVVTFSEFGRRVKENGSLGTDHGAAGPMFVLHPPKEAGLLGKHPSLTDLDQEGDLKYHTDFRAVYATLLENWLGHDSQPILQTTFPKLTFA